MPALFQLLILRGALWQHQYWESPLVPFIAIAVALAVMLLADLIAKVNRWASYAAILAVAAVVAVYCASGLNYYYSIRWQPAEKIKMFKDLNARIAPDKSLLSFYDDFTVNQNAAKGSHYRPEIAWYLDRPIQKVMSLDEIEKFAKTGNYPCFLIPNVKELAPLINVLSKQYKYEDIPGVEGETTKDGKFLKAGMYPYRIVDLNSRVGNG